MGFDLRISDLFIIDPVRDHSDRYVIRPQRHLPGELADGNDPGRFFPDRRRERFDKSEPFLRFFRRSPGNITQMRRDDIGNLHFPGSCHRHGTVGNSEMHMDQIRLKIFAVKAAILHRGGHIPHHGAHLRPERFRAMAFQPHHFQPFDIFIFRKITKMCRHHTDLMAGLYPLQGKVPGDRSAAAPDGREFMDDNKYLHRNLCLNAF